MAPPRRDDRKPVSLPATVRAGSRSFRDVVTNVSPGGLYLQGDDHRLRPGERVRISFSLPVGERLVPVDVDGRVARLVKDGRLRTKGLGIELVSPKPSVLEAIEAHLESREKQTSGGSPAMPEPDGPPRPPPIPAAARVGPETGFLAEAPPASDSGLEEERDTGRTFRPPAEDEEIPPTEPGFLAEAPDESDPGLEEPEPRRPATGDEVPTDPVMQRPDDWDEEER